LSKRTGKTHENLEAQVTPPPTVTDQARARPAATRQARGDRSGPIGISGGDFATPTARKRTTTQPRGLPVVGPAAEAAPVNVNGAPPPPPVEGAQPESPFVVPATGEVGDAASQLAAEAAAVRALDSGPLTPPPEVHDPGPTPPPVVEPAPAPEASAAQTPRPVQVTPPPLDQPIRFTPSDAESAFGEQPSAEPGQAEVPHPAMEAAPELGSDAPTPPPVIDAPASAAAEVEPAIERENFAAQETPWPELGAHMRASTPIPGAIPTDSIANAGEAAELAVPAPVEPVAPNADGSDVAAADAHVHAGDDLELDEGSLDALPAEALSDPGPAPANDLDAVSRDVSPPPAPVAATPPPTPKVPPAPPPIPSGTPRRKTGETRPSEVAPAQVLATLMPEPPPGAPPLPEALAQRPRRPKRSKPWFEEVFDEDYLRTLPFMSADQTLREVEFIEGSLGLRPGARVLDIGCGYGRHAIELVQRGLDVTGLDLSLPLLIRAADEAQKRAMSVNFVHADMREMAFEQQFDGAYSMLTSFGYFDEDANLRVAEGIARALKPGARFLLDLVNRDYVVGDLPSRVWWEGNGCVVLEEVDFNFHTSRILTHRSIVFEDGRQVEQEISVRAYSLHEIGRLLRQAGFRVLDISGSLATRGHFFGGTSRSLLILAEKRSDDAP
jgi:SAM-dependent methyltransferase